MRNYIEQDFYARLGVPQNASQQEIRRAYQKLARKFHPDVSTERNSEEMFKWVKQAYDTLKTKAGRDAYDQILQPGRSRRENNDRRAYYDLWEEDLKHYPDASKPRPTDPYWAILLLRILPWVWIFILVFMLHPSWFL